MFKNIKILLFLIRNVDVKNVVKQVTELCRAIKAGKADGYDTNDLRIIASELFDVVEAIIPGFKTVSKFLGEKEAMPKELKVLNKSK